jgi:hypothetical protein
MGVNLTAIFPQQLSQEKIHQLLDTIEKQEYASIKTYYNTTLAEGFPDISSTVSQWYLHDQKVSQIPKLPDIQAELALKEGLVLKIGDDGFALWSMIRAFLAISLHPKILEKFQEICIEIMKDVNITECWILGDDNPIYHAFNQNKEFKLMATNNLQVNNIHDLYQELKPEDSYEIKGHYRLTRLQL